MLTRVSSLLATLMLLLDKNDLDNLWHSDIKRTDCFIKKKKRERERVNKGREKGGERAYVTILKLVQMTKSFEIAFTADSTYSLGVGNPRSRLDYSCLKKLLKVL